MDLEETEGKNNFAGEGQQQFYRPTEAVSCEMVASRRRCKHESKRILIVGNSYLATRSEDIEEFTFAAVAVICRACRYVKRLYLPVVTSYTRRYSVY
jgi:hypothetical protein